MASAQLHHWFSHLTKETQCGLSVHMNATPEDGFSWALKALQGYCTLVPLRGTSVEALAHWYRLLQKSDMSPLTGEPLPEAWQ